MKRVADYIDFKLTLFLACFYSLASFIHFAKNFFLVYINKENYHLIETIILYGIDWFIVVGFMQLVAILTKMLILKKVSWKRILPIHILLSLLLGFLLQLMTDSYGWFLGNNEGIDYSTSLRTFLSYMDIDFLTFFSMDFIIFSYYYFENSRREEEHKNLLQNQLLTSRMKMLTAQIQPHFLFNTINCIVSLIRKDPRRAEDTLIDLSEFFREITHSTNSHFVTVEKEVKILEHYINILKVRFQENLTIKIDVPQEVFPLYIPAIVLQPLIENSINHGYSYSNPELEIKVKMSLESERLLIVVENNGSLMMEQKRSRSGVGISNIRERLQNMYGSNFCFDIKNKKDGSGVENVLSLPVMVRETNDLSQHVISDVVNSNAI